MSKRSGFEHLKKDYPIFLIKNKTSVNRTLDLIGDNDMQIPASSTQKVASEDLYQMPDSTYFRVIEPKMAVLVKYGILKNPDEEGADSSASSKKASSTSNDTSSSDESKTVPTQTASVDATNVDGKSGRSVDK